jgi:hypothetical protein
VSEPNDATVLGCDLHIRKDAEGVISLSGELAELLVQARSGYAWPKRCSPSTSQQSIIDLERDTHQRIESLDDEKAHWIIQQVSLWGGNRGRAQPALDHASSAEKKEFAGLIQALLSPGSFEKALSGLSAKPGVDLVIATKVYRFCWPEGGAAVDRHSSYFFNSLDFMHADGKRTKCCHFRRQRSGQQTRTGPASRLAIYDPSGRGRDANLREYAHCYLPLLSAVAASLNDLAVTFTCAATGAKKGWRPADVEMAAYQWWSRNGPP